MKKIFSTIILLGVAVIFNQANAQGVTDLTNDVRSAGMGDAHTALYGRGFSIYTNSAAAALSDDDFAISANYTLWQPEMVGMNNFAVGAFYKFSDRYTVGLGARGLMQSISNLTDDNGTPLGDDFMSTKISVDASFGMLIIDGFSAAVNLHFFYDKVMPDAQGLGFGADIDLMYSHKYFNVALSAKNLGPNISYDSFTKSPLPMEIRAGYSGNYEVVDDILDITPAVDVNYLLNSSTVTAGVGAEFKFIDMVSIRGGYRYSPNLIMPSYATVGIGVEFFDFAIDAAYYIGTGVTDVLTNSFKVGLSYKF